MKKSITFLLTFFILVIAYSCAVKKSISALPCEKEAFDDDNFIRQLGVGVSNNMQSARTFALQDARQKMFLRFCDSIKSPINTMKIDTVNCSYTVYINNNDSILFSFAGTFGSLSKCCEKITLDKEGKYHSFVSVETNAEDFNIAISRQKFRYKMLKYFTENEKDLH